MKTRTALAAIAPAVLAVGIAGAAISSANVGVAIPATPRQPTTVTTDSLDDSAAPSDTSEVGNGDPLVAVPEAALDSDGSYQLTTADRDRIVTTDKTATLDSAGRVSFKDPRPPQPRDRSRGQTENLPYAAGDTFKLHSRPGSTRTIYLDFNGQRLTGTDWNASSGQATLVAAPYDEDGNPRAFSTNELAKIQNAYLNVREDFAAFDVDVTTEDPGEAALRRNGSSDDTFGIRVLVTPTNFVCGPDECGGRAHLNSFGSANGTPAVVLAEAFWTGKFIGEAASHETGHTLGLAHDGAGPATGPNHVEYYPGHGNWAPIMGDSYDAAVTTWSRGEYANADNKQDDFAVIAAHGAPLIADDVSGGTSTTATLPAGERRYGVVGASGDVDTYRFSLTGTRKLTIKAWNNVGGVPADLNIRLVLRNSAGQTVVTAVPTGTLGASFTTSLPKGTYYVSVSGAGEDNPVTNGYSSYASAGFYGIELNWA